MAAILAIAAWAVPVSARGAAVHFDIGRSFPGVSYGTFNTNSSALPPDCNGDIGPNHYVEFVNGVFAVYSKTSGGQVEFKTDIDFWASAGVGIDTSEWGVSDPRVIYDPLSQRWFASQIDVDELTQVFDGVLGTNHFLLAVSDTADPTGPWHGTLFDSDPDSGNFADFPTLGVDSEGVYLAADMFDSAGDPTTATDIACSLVMFRKTDLLATNFNNPTFFPNMSFAARGQIYQPATCADGSGVGCVLAAGDIGSDSSFHSNLVTFAVQNVAGPGAATLGPSSFLTVLPYQVPDNVAVGTPLLTALQPDGTTTLQANDARFSAKVYTVGGIAYGVHNTLLNGRVAIRWYRISVASGALVESGTLADPDLDLFYPSIAANLSGTVVIGCNSSGPGTNYISGCAFVGQTVNQVTTFNPRVIVCAGVTSYHGDDEDTSGLGLGNPTSRWGDYSATGIDPTDSSRFWTIQMFPTDVNVWSTRITELVTTPLQLLASQSGTNVTVSWPSLLVGYQLQFATNITSTVWSNVTQTPLTNGTMLYVTQPLSRGNRFFRLQ